jgi:transcriptional regulator with XRE-family HTH domain
MLSIIAPEPTFPIMVKSRQFNAEIAERLRAARQARGLTRKQAAALAGKPQRWLEHYEQGTTTISEEALQLLGAVYGLHPAALRYGSDAVIAAAPGALWPELTAVLSAADTIEQASRKLADLAGSLRRLSPAQQAIATADDELLTPDVPADAAPMAAATPRRRSQK